MIKKGNKKADTKGQVESNMTDRNNENSKKEKLFDWRKTISQTKYKQRRRKKFATKRKKEETEENKRNVKEKKKYRKKETKERRKER